MRVIGLRVNLLLKSILNMIDHFWVYYVKGIRNLLFTKITHFRRFAYFHVLAFNILAFDVLAFNVLSFYVLSLRLFKGIPGKNMNSTILYKTLAWKPSGIFQGFSSEIVLELPSEIS